ncbi:MAG: ABC transporter substrate-binding protein [Hyphomicrobiaceae bacterium]
MSASDLDLSIALSINERTKPILDGRIRPQGIRLLATGVHPSEMFWRQLKYQDFDVSEMSMSSLIIATVRGDRTWAALPIFTTREFFHTRTLVRVDAGIEKPQDLKGKRVGVPEYQQTAAIWSRGVLQHEFGVKPSDITWYMERTPEVSHGGATGFKPPAGVTLNRIPTSTNIGEMLIRDELDATLLYLTDKNLVDRSTVDVLGSGKVKRLFPDMHGEGTRYYGKTGLYPINHGVVVRRSILEQHPWVALNLYKAFVAAKELVTANMTSALEPYFATGMIAGGLKAQNAVDGLGHGFKPALPGDPLGYGIKASREVLETIIRYNHEQGLTAEPVKLEDLFWKSTLDL